MKKLKVLIADDSVVYRSQIRAALGELAWIEVVGASSNGKLALERLQQTQVDLLILDLEMPEMDGLKTLDEMNRVGIQCKTLVFSSLSKRGSEVTMEALRKGASDFIAKPGSSDGGLTSQILVQPSTLIRTLLEPKIYGLFPEYSTSPSPQVKVANSRSENFPSVIWDLFQPKVVVIGSSTGGPTVLETLFTALTGPLKCPILIAQHMPPIFTATLAERLERLSGIPTFEAKNGQILESNAVYVAPGNYHMTLEEFDGQVRIVLDQSPLVNSVRPAVDPLFVSASAIFKEKCLGMVLTGMGADGKIGAEAIKRAGGAVVIQSEKSSVVFGMPGAVFACGAYDRIMDPAELIQTLKEKIAPLRSLDFLPMLREKF